MAFICGSFNNQEEDDFEVLWPSPATPTRKTTRRHSFCSRSNKDSKNPYSNRGLDKFEALLAELQDKRQKIFTQKGSEDISLVRFVYSNSNNVKPIVVKLRERKQHDQKDEKDQKLNVESPKTTNSRTKSLDHQKSLNVERPKTTEIKGTQEAECPLVECTKKVGLQNIKRKLGEVWRPSYCFPLFVILILVFLALFGRSFAILCTSIGWYLVPTINGKFENSKKPKKIMKKEISKKFNEKTTTPTKISSPRSVLNGPMNDQGHRRSF